MGLCHEFAHEVYQRFPEIQVGRQQQCDILAQMTGAVPKYRIPDETEQLTQRVKIILYISIWEQIWFIKLISL